MRWLSAPQYNVAGASAVLRSLRSHTVQAWTSDQTCDEGLISSGIALFCLIVIKQQRLRWRNSDISKVSWPCEGTAVHNDLPFSILQTPILCLFFGVPWIELLAVHFLQHSYSRQCRLFDDPRQRRRLEIQQQQERLLSQPSVISGKNPTETLSDW